MRATPRPWRCHEARAGAALACQLALCLTLAASPAAAQVGSIALPAPVITPVAAWNAPASNAPVTLANSLTLLINSGSVQTIPSLVNNRINVFPQPVSITTQWQLSGLVSVIDLVGYFSAPSAALSNGSANIPSGRVEGRMPTGRVAGFTPFTQRAVAGVGTAGGTLHLFRQPIVIPTNGQSSRTDNLELQLDLRGTPNLPPGTYRGTITLRAIAY
jgi:hypothetical protein